MRFFYLLSLAVVGLAVGLGIVANFYRLRRRRQVRRQQRQFPVPRSESQPVEIPPAQRENLLGDLAATLCFPWLFPVLALAWGLYPQAAWAIDDPVPAVQPAKAVVTDQFGNPPPLTVPFGRLLVFSAKTSVRGTSPNSVKWTIKPDALDSRKWTPNASEFAVAAEKLDANGTPYEMTVLLSVASGDTVDHVILRVKCGEGDLPPPVVPDVTPNPPPNIVERLGLVTASIAGKRRNVSPEPLRSQEAAAIAKAHRAAVATAKLNPFGLITALEGDLAQRVGAALDVNARLRWKPWQDAVKERQDVLLKSGQLTTRDNWLEAYEEIATGLEQGK